MNLHLFLMSRAVIPLTPARVSFIPAARAVSWTCVAGQVRRKNGFWTYGESRSNLLYLLYDAHKLYTILAAHTLARLRRAAAGWPVRAGLEAATA